MKIAIDGSVLWGHYSGVEKTADRVIRRLLADPRGHQIRIFVPGDWPGFEEDGGRRTDDSNPAPRAPRPAPHAPRPASRACFLPFSGARRMRRIFWQQVELPWILRRWRADVLFCPAYVMPLLSPCPAVTFVHDLHGLNLRQTRLENYLHYRLLLPPTIRRARALITPTRAVQLEVERRFGRRAFVAPLGVDPWFTPRDAQSNEPGVVPYILYVGNLEERKGLRLLIESCGNLFARQPNLTLILAGKDRGLRPQLVEIAARLGIAERVRFLGYVETERLVDLYREAALLDRRRLWDTAVGGDGVRDSGRRR